MIPPRWLTICIPTYNRPELLKATLARFIPQAIEHNAVIAISDNSSDDRTEKMVDELSGLHSFIRYRKNAKNIRFDRNLFNAVAISDTPYIWLFGDDDWPDASAIGRIKQEIEDGDPDVLIVNAAALDQDMTTILAPNLSGITKDFRTTGSGQLFDLAWYCSFVGGIVVRKSAWDCIDHRRFFDTGFLHTGAVFSILTSPVSRISFISDPLVSYRGNAAGWSASFLSTMFRSWPLMIKRLPDSYEAQEKERAALSAPMRFARLPALANLRRNGFLSVGGVIRNFGPFWAMRPFNRFAIQTAVNCTALLCVPPVLIGKMMDLRKSMMRAAPVEPRSQPPQRAS